MSVTEMAKMVSLSKTTVSKIFTRLSDRGMILPVGRANSTEEGGKRRVLFALRPDFCYAVILSMGFAEHVSCTLVDFTGVVVCRKKISTTADSEYGEILSLAVSLIHEVLEETGIPFDKICGIAVSYDGIIDTINGTILDSAHRDWKGPLPIRDDLRALLPNTGINIVVDNACSFAGYAELAFPEQLPGNKLVIIWDADRTLGCSLLADNRLVINREGITGSFAHVVIDTASSIPCRCGVNGCLQSVLSYEAFCDYFYRRKSEFPDSPLTKKVNNEPLEIQDVFLCARENDPFALDIMDHMVNYFAILIYNAFSMHASQKVILQGMFALSGNLFLDRLKDRLLNFNRLHAYRDIDVSYSLYKPVKKLGKLNPYTKGAAMLLSDQFLHLSGDI